MDADADCGQLATPPDAAPDASTPPFDPTSTGIAAAAPLAGPQGDSDSLRSPEPSRETARTFLRDAQLATTPIHSSGAGRITAVMKRLGSVPAPQVKADLATFRDRIIDLLGIAAGSPRIDVGRFLLGYSRSITRHPRLHSSLQADPAYRRILHRLIFIPPHTSLQPGDGTAKPPAPSLRRGDGTGDVPVPDGAPAEQLDVWSEATDAGGRGDDTRGRLSTLSSAAHLPRAFENPTTFPMFLTALLRLHLCPRAFWESLTCWGIPYVPDPASGGMGPPAAVADPHRPTAPRPGWEQKNAAIAISLAELLSLRYAEEAPAEGLDARRRPRRTAERPALPTPAARLDVESFGASAVPLMTADEVARLLYSLGQTGVAPRPDVLCTLEEAAMRHSGGMAMRQLALLLGGYAGMRVRPGPLLEDTLARRMDKVAPSISIHALHIMMLQTAKLGATLPEDTFVALVRRMRALVADGAFEALKFTPRLLWSCAVYAAVHGREFGRRVSAGRAAWELLEGFAGLWEAGRLGCDADAMTLLRQVLPPAGLSRWSTCTILRDGIVRSHALTQCMTTVCVPAVCISVVCVTAAHGAAGPLLNRGPSRGARLDDRGRHASEPLRGALPARCP